MFQKKTLNRKYLQDDTEQNIWNHSKIIFQFVTFFFYQEIYVTTNLFPFLFFLFFGHIRCEMLIFCSVWQYIHNIVCLFIDHSLCQWVNFLIIKTYTCTLIKIFELACTGIEISWSKGQGQIIKVILGSRSLNSMSILVI